MVKPVLTSSQITALEREFTSRLERNANMARHTSLRVGGKADFLLRAKDVDQLAETAAWLWDGGIPFMMLGSGTNVLISDQGIRGLVLLNKADRVRFEERSDGEPFIWAASGAALGLIARRAAARGWSGLEWAAGIPGSVGGAVFGNAGAHGEDMATSMKLAEILHRKGAAAVRETWLVDRFNYEYRSSILKKRAVNAVVLSATFSMRKKSPGRVKVRIKEFAETRKKSQPGGASLGSMFKNPPGDYAGRLIDAAGLKGARRGGAEISPVHANFFLNRGKARADDFMELIQLARTTVRERFGIELELEIELVGDWEGIEQDE